MLNIIRSGFCASGGERIRREIIASAKKNDNVLLIVPEQQTLLAECEMADLLPPSAPLNFEVTNFTRLANTAARALGGISGEYCDNTKKALLMWRALTELSPILSGVRGGINEGLVERYLSASANLDALGISPSALSEAELSEYITDDRLRHKLRDLAAVHSLYKRLASERYGTAENETALMLDKLRENRDYLRSADIYIEGFISFTETQYALIGLLLERCNVTVLLYISRNAEDSFEYTELKDTLERLKRLARNADTELRIFKEYTREESDVISLAADMIWRTSAVSDNETLQNQGKIRIFEAETPFDECEFVASDIKRRVMEGASFSDFAIVARDADRYKGVLDTALTLADIPAFISNSADISSLEGIKLIFAAYSVFRSGYSRESVITYAKCALGGISRDECDELEYYAEKWQITGSRFSCGEDFTMNPEGYKTSWSEEAAERLSRINAVKDRLILPLIAFEAEARAAKTVREQAEALYRHLSVLGLEAALREKCDSLLAVGERIHGENELRLWRIICDTLDTLVEVSGDMPSDAEAFREQLKTAFGSIGIRRIPSYVDEVTVGSADMLRLYGKRHIYLIGVNAGEFPAAATDNAYFTEADKSALAKCGLAITPDLQKRGARELYLFARAFTYARESVTLLYSAKKGDYSPRERSDVIDRIKRIFGDTLSVCAISELLAEKRLYSARSALSALSSLDREARLSAEAALERAGYTELLRISGEKITNEDLTLSESITAGSARTLALTQSRIDAYKNCPLGYFCRYTLALSPEERAEFDARNIGTFIHAILENVFRELSERTEDKPLTREEEEEITRRAARKYVESLGEGGISSERTKIKINRLIRASLPVTRGLCEEFSKSKFKPRFFELAITRGREDCPEPLTLKTVGGREALIYGVIDRVDSYKDGEDVYVRVVDYKTGAKVFSPDDPKNGRNLQMFLYLKSILDSENGKFKEKLGVGEGGRIIPAGVIYVKTSVADTRVDSPDDSLAEEAVSALQKREGMVLDDGGVISAMGLRYTPLYSAARPDKILDSKKKFLFTEESLAGIMEDCMTVVSDVADGISDGNIKAQPRVQDDGGTYCESCEFKPICRKAVIV